MMRTPNRQISSLNHVKPFKKCDTKLTQRNAHEKAEQAHFDGESDIRLYFVEFSRDIHVFRKFELSSH